MRGCSLFTVSVSKAGKGEGHVRECRRLELNEHPGELSSPGMGAKEEEEGARCSSSH